MTGNRSPPLTLPSPRRRLYEPEAVKGEGICLGGGWGEAVLSYYPVFYVHKKKEEVFR